MAKYYFGRDSTKEYWINLDQVSFIQKEKDKLILKMLNGMNIFIDGEDVDAFTQMLWSETVNWDEEYKDNDKRHNQEDIPPPPPNDFSDDDDYGYPEDEYSDLKRDDEDDDDFFPTGIPVEESEF